MQTSSSDHGRSRLKQSPRRRDLELFSSLNRDLVSFNGILVNPVRVREALSVFFDALLCGPVNPRNSLSSIADPLMTVTQEVVCFEGFAGDEGSSVCLTLDRASTFQQVSDVAMGTTNIESSWQLYDAIQHLRSYRETRMIVNATQPQTIPSSSAASAATDWQGELSTLPVSTLPDGWWRGFMQMQAAMTLPMTKVSLSVDAVYSLLAWLKRHRDTSGSRAIRIELREGEPARLIPEPSGTVIESHAGSFQGATVEPIRIWGRRQLMALARILPLATNVDVYLLGTGLPSFWVARMGQMQLTLGVTGWNSNHRVRGSVVQVRLPAELSAEVTETACQILREQNAISFGMLAKQLRVSSEEAAAVACRLALRGFGAYDLDARLFRWRPLLPAVFSNSDIAKVHPEILAAEQFAASGKIRINTAQPSGTGAGNGDGDGAGGGDGGVILQGKVEHQPCEIHIDANGVILNGKCNCSWHQKAGVRNVPCRHLAALRIAMHSHQSETQQ